ncbi:hypothetical protein [Ruminococcus albus]|uniref:Uncharacterized protein n=1 Tax=Ruminococcus albus TaxID=1264 RepID=A0A1I1N163_RUMAL|nr:hypothetical protein [Ruminococcus albus]SFC89218.1 hypothetical protein SAMN02910406_02600 [Ruminococcus albus]
MTFIGVSTAVYLIAAVLLRKVSKNTISCGICIYLPVIVTTVMITSSRTPSMRGVGEAGGLFAVLIFMFASVPTYLSITCIRDLIAEGGSASRKAIIWHIIGVVTCVPLSIFINRKIAKPFTYYLHHTTILTYILLAVTFAVGVFLIIKGHQHKRYISNLIKMKEMNENGKE